MRKVLRGILLAVAVASVFFMVAVYLMTTPAKARPFASGVSANPASLRSDVEALTGLPGLRCFERPDDLDYERLAHVVTGIYVAMTAL